MSTKKMKKSFTPELGVGERIRIIRLQNRLSQLEMAQKLGISVSQYSKIEVGLRNIGKEPLHILCKSFEVTSDHVLYGNAPIKKNASPVASVDYREPLSLMNAFEKIARELHLSFESVSKSFSEMANKSKNGEMK